MAAYALTAWFLLLVARAHRATLSDQRLATEAEAELELGGGMKFWGKEIGVAVGEDAEWSAASARRAAACGIEFELLAADGLEGWYVVGAQDGARGCAFHSVGGDPVAVGMRLEGEPGQKKFALAYVPAVFHVDEAAGPRSLALGEHFPERASACEAERVGLYCSGAPTSYRCAAWLHWKQDGDSCAFKTSFDLTSLSAAEKDAGHGGAKAEGYEELLTRVRTEYAAYRRAGLRLAALRVKHYKLDKSEEKEGGSWSMAMAAAAEGLTLKIILEGVLSFAKNRGWFSQGGNNCQAFATWLATAVAGKPSEATLWPLGAPEEGRPFAPPSPDVTGSAAAQDERELEAGAEE